MQPIDILSAERYFNGLLEQIPHVKPGGRIAIISMTLHHHEPLIARLLDELGAAAERGVDVHLVVDAYTFMISLRGLPTGPMYRLRTPAIDNGYFGQKFAVLESLKRRGVHYAITNAPRARLSNPVAGRSHIKATVIDDVAYIGGCNLEDPKQVDLMTKLSSKDFADTVYSLILEVAEQRDTKRLFAGHDQVIKIDQHTSLLLDVGIPSQSLIMRRALDLLDSAQEWIVLTCQFFPNNVTAQRLAAAHKRGVRIYVYYNHPAKQTGFSQLAHHALIQLERSRHPRELFMRQLPPDHRRVHAKLIATDKGAIIGSHNYIQAGVRFGTAEVAIIRHDSDFARQALATIKPLLQNM